jgi:hypothetical protein
MGGVVKKPRFMLRGEILLPPPPEEPIVINITMMPPREDEIQQPRLAAVPDNVVGINEARRRRRGQR